MDVKAAIRCGDAAALRRLLSEDASGANAVIHWGKDDAIRTHPLHFVSDMVFEGALQETLALPLIDALIEAGADLDFQTRREDGRTIDTPLIGAASLGAEYVGLQLVIAGARPELRGLFGETALHWASLFGEDRLVAKLIPGSDINLKDEKYNSPPLGWAIHGCYDPPSEKYRKHHEVARLLVEAGATIEPQWLESEQVRGDAAMLAALRAGIQ